MILTQRIGDTKTHSVKLAWEGRPFVPGNDWHLVFTVKSNPDDEDVAALFQLETNNGVTSVGRTANVSVARSLTINLLPVTAYWDVQAEKKDSEDVRTVAIGRLSLLRDITRSRRSAVAGSSLRDDAGLAILDDQLQPLIYT